MNTEKFKGVFPAFYACYDEEWRNQCRTYTASGKTFMEKGCERAVCGWIFRRMYLSKCRRSKENSENVMKAVKGKLTVCACCMQ